MCANLWLAEVTNSARSLCPTCKVRLDPSNAVVSIGYYYKAQYQHVTYACRECYIDEIHKYWTKGRYNLMIRSSRKVRWLTGEEQVVVTS